MEKNPSIYQTFGAFHDLISVEKKIPNTEDFTRWPHLTGINTAFHEVSEDEITLLIGADRPEAFIAKEYRQGKTGQPIGILGIFGWSLFGPSTSHVTNEISKEKECNMNLIQTHKDKLEFQVDKFWSLETLGLKFNDSRKFSIEDREALDQMSSSIELLDDKHYQLRLPWKNENVNLPSNRSMACKRLTQLSRKLSKDKELFEKYSDVIHEYVDKGFASEISPEEKSASNSTWYIPHHAVLHPNKPGKVRVVFDCSAESHGVSLNSKLLSGPDLTNNLVSVLLRFRTENVAVVGDIEAMFHQVRVTPSDRDALRFLWWQTMT